MSTEGAPHHLSFAGVQLETTNEHPATDGAHAVRNPDVKAFTMVWLVVTCMPSSYIFKQPSPCARMTLSSSAVCIVKRRGPRSLGVPRMFIEVEDDSNSP